MLQANQRFLGEGIPHTFVSQQGTFLLPRATAGTALPIISVGPMGSTTVVTLASGNEVSGFDIRPALLGTGIRGSGITDFNINRNVFTGSAGTQTAILLENTPGVGFITGNISTGIVGISYRQDNTNTRTSISGNTITGPAGILVQTTGTSQQVLGITSNTVVTSLPMNGVNVLKFSAASNICLRLANNSSSPGGYLLVNAFGGMFQAENTFGTNTGGAVTTVGPITLVAPGSCPVP